MEAFCTTDGSDFFAGETYHRDTGNSFWIPSLLGNMYDFGDSSDGDVTISSNTDLTTDNVKNYHNLTINSGIVL